MSISRAPPVGFSRIKHMASLMYLKLHKPPLPPPAKTKLLLEKLGFFNWHIHWSELYQLSVLYTETDIRRLREIICRELYLSRLLGLFVNRYPLTAFDLFICLKVPWGNLT